MKITDYILVKGNTSVELSNSVQRGIAQGWQPYGTPFWADEHSYCQATVKYEEAWE